jgi:hypothetical protein
MIQFVVALLAVFFGGLVSAQTTARVMTGYEAYGLFQ